MMNPLTATGQIKGGAMMGIGMALHEELTLRPRSGQPLTAGYYGASRLTHRDAPEIEVIFIESDDGYGPYGAKSMGESGNVPAVAAVGNAIFNAIGRRMKDLPITRDKILEATRMKTFANANARDSRSKPSRSPSKPTVTASAAFAGGGSDLLGLVKERIVTPDVLVNLRSIRGSIRSSPSRGGVNIGGLITLERLATTR